MTNSFPKHTVTCSENAIRLIIFARKRNFVFFYTFIDCSESKLQISVFCIHNKLFVPPQQFNTVKKSFTFTEAIIKIKKSTQILRKLFFFLISIQNILPIQIKSRTFPSIESIWMTNFSSLQNEILLFHLIAKA